MSQVVFTEVAAWAALTRLMAARKDAALAELAYVEIAQAQLAELELNNHNSQQEMDDQIREEALQLRDIMFAEPQPEPAAKVDQVDQADQAPPAAEPQEAAAELQPAPQPELPADPRARRKAGIA